jgi:hypothetical protein
MGRSTIASCLSGSAIRFTEVGAAQKLPSPGTRVRDVAAVEPRRADVDPGARVVGQNMWLKLTYTPLSSSLTAYSAVMIVARFHDARRASP